VAIVDPLVSSVRTERLNGTAIVVTLDLIYTGGGDITSITLSWTNGLILNTDQPRRLSSGQWTGMIVNSMLSVLDYSSELEFTVRIMNERFRATSQTAIQSFGKYKISQLYSKLVCFSCKDITFITVKQYILF